MTSANASRARQALAALAMTLASSALAHRGGMDVYGCHPDDKAGGYHCHQGILAGLGFRSRAEMLGLVENWRKAPLLPPAMPQASRPTFDALSVCAESDDQQRRLACFDRIAPRKQ
jgi:hypothetical protein